MRFLASWGLYQPRRREFQAMKPLLSNEKPCFLTLFVVLTHKMKLNQRHEAQQTGS